MIVLDTDVIGRLQKWIHSDSSEFLERLESSSEEIATTVITVEEQMRGWLARIRRQQKPHNQIATYSNLQYLFEFFADWTILPWDQDAADNFVRLRKENVRIGTMDLKIACIVLTRDALLVSRNLRDFERVPDLHVEDWLQ